MNDLRYILKRVIVGVLIALLLMIIRGTLIHKVYAKTTITGGYVIATPSGTTLENYDEKYYTNIDYDPTLSYRDITALDYSFLINYTTPHSFGHYSRFVDINEQVDMNGRSTGDSIRSLTIALGGTQGANHIEFGKNYSVALPFTKDTSIEWAPFNPDRTYLYFHIYDMTDPLNPIYLDSDSFVKIDDFNFYTYQDNNQDTNRGVLIINFHLDENDYVFNYNNLVLQSILYNRYCPHETQNCTTPDSTVPFFPVIVNNTSGATKHFINKQLYFIEGTIVPYGAVCNTSEDHQGCQISGDTPLDTGGMDIVHDYDIEVMDELPICSDLDIPCHLKRITQSVNDFFVRFGNFFLDFKENLKLSFLELFVPSESYFSDFIDDMTDTIETQFGFLLYPITLFSNIINRFVLLERSSTISYDGFYYPGTDKLIIPSFSINLDSYFSSGALYTLYQTYFTFINGLFVFMFLRLCVRKFNSIFGGGGL